MEKETLLLPAFDPVEDGETIALAGRILREGGIAAIPTETVYGLAGNALDPEATKIVFESGVPITMYGRITPLSFTLRSWRSGPPWWRSCRRRPWSWQKDTGQGR